MYENMCLVGSPELLVGVGEVELVGCITIGATLHTNMCLSCTFRHNFKRREANRVADDRR